MGATPTPADAMAEAVERHAEAIMKAAGFPLRHYMKATHDEILMAVMGCYKEAYRAGVNRITTAVNANDALVEALKTIRSFGCPVCSGDCGSANPPVAGCPMQMMGAAIALSAASASETGKEG